MQQSERNFPPDYDVLEKYFDWSLSTERERLERRYSIPYAKTEAFYRALTPMMEGILDFLNQKPLAELDQQEANLFYLTLSYAEASFAVEMYGAPDSKYSVTVEDMTLVNDAFDIKIPAAV